MHTCNISSRTTCRRGTVVQQQDLPAAAAAAAACSGSKLQKQEAAESTDKQKCGLSCAPRHPLESAPSFFRCPLRPPPSRTTYETKMGQSSCSKFSPADACTAIAQSTLDANRRGILSSSYLHNRQASSAVSAPQQRPKQGSTVMNKAS